MADFDLGGLLFGNAPSSGLEGYLDPEQLRRMQQQGVMQAAMALLKASGPSTQRVGLGQALGEAYGAGQAGYQQAQQQGIAGLLTKQKLEEAERARKMQENYARMVAGLTGGQAPEMGAMTSESALAAPVTPQLPAGPTIARAEMIGQPTRNLGGGGGAMQRGTLTPQMAMLLSQMTAKEGIPELMKYLQPPKTQGQAFKAADGNYYIQTENGGVIPAPIAPADLGAEEYGAPVAQVVNGQIRMVQYNKKGEPRIAQGTMPYEPQSPDIRSVEYLLGRNLSGTGAAGIGEVGNYRQQIAPKTNVNVKPVIDMTGGQPGFENEMKLSSAFKNEPIYKEYQGMQTAFNQVNTALNQETPIGDLAGATKMMKLMDEGSVVRETELALAMAAAGRMDRLKNYLNQAMTGQKLTPTQRVEFKALSNELYAAAGQAYNNKRQEYEAFGTSYGFKNLGTALGKPAQIPSLMGGGPGGVGTDVRSQADRILSGGR